MSWTPTDEQVEKAVETFRDNYSFRQHDAEWIARAVLVAVGPHIAAQALRDAAEDFLYNAERDVPLPGYGDLHARADQIEKEAGR